jgi:hypothetical protein
MKSTIIVFLLLTAASAQPGEPREFRGEIADSSCALNVHSLTRSHQEMLKAKYLGSDAGSCARYCVRHLGSAYVLVSGKNVYRLDRQKDAEEFAGKKVTLKGSLDDKTNTIQVVTIGAAPAPSR